MRVNVGFACIPLREGYSLLQLAFIHNYSPTVTVTLTLLGPLSTAGRAVT